MRRGEIWWSSLPVPRGSEPGFHRPILIVQSDAFNKSRIRTVVAVVLTSNIRQGNAPGNVRLSRSVTGLPKTSVANVSQVITIDKSFLTKKVKSLPQRELARIDAGLKLVLSL